MNFTKNIMRVPDRESLWIILIILVTGSFFSTLIPPFQSPDEFDHIKRAYLLSKGTIVLDTPKDMSSGGMIDSGLAAYMAAYSVLPRKSDRKLSADEIDSARNISWTGVKEFSQAPGTGYYFPIIYMPQAMGLVLGESLGLTIDTSYRIARFMALVSIAAILIAAFNVYPVNPLTIALLILPMSIFQFSSASLDGISTALAIFSISAFFRLAHKKTSGSWLFYALTLSVVLVATSRTHLLPLLALVLATCFYTNNKKHFYIFAAALFFTIAWLAITIKTTIDTKAGVGAPTASVALFYIKNPLLFFDILIATLSNSNEIKNYYYSFFGALGWLDAGFNKKTYSYLFVCTLMICLFSVSVKNLKAEWPPRLIVLFSSFISVLLAFFALLITWNPHPASLIKGMQGRYFLVPMIMVAYAISGELKLYDGFFRKIALFLVILLLGLTIFSTPRLLIERYYLALEQPEPISVVRASNPLKQNSPIMLFITEAHKKNPQPLKRIGILFGTYVRKNPGSAKLRLTTSDGHALVIPFGLPDLAENQYKYFEIDSIPYAYGQIFYLTGGGISTWESHEQKGAIATCIIFEYSNGQKLYTRGCPRPLFD